MKIELKITDEGFTATHEICFDTRRDFSKVEAAVVKAITGFQDSVIIHHVRPIAQAQAITDSVHEALVRNPGHFREPTR